MIYEYQVWPVLPEMLFKSLASETTAQAAPESATYLPANSCTYTIVAHRLETCYRIVGNCRGRKLSQIIKKKDFHGENFREQPQNHIICENVLPRKFPAIQYEPSSLCLMILHMQCPTLW